MVRFEPVGCDGVMVRYAHWQDAKAIKRIALHAKTARSIEGVIEAVVSYGSLWVMYDRAYWCYEHLCDVLQKEFTHASLSDANSKRMHTIEVSYGQSKDLEAVATACMLRPKEVIALHTRNTYLVYAIGFLPQFAYLGMVDSVLKMPRKKHIQKVPKGAVAIAGRQTAIYPQKSLGGWYVLGITDFEGYEDFEIGDSVRFKEV